MLDDPRRLEILNPRVLEIAHSELAQLPQLQHALLKGAIQVY
jgi:hypothetical protein